MSTVHIIPAMVRDVIQTRCNLVQLPMDLALSDFAIKDFQLINIRLELGRRFGKDVPVRFSDSIYTLTDKLNAV